MNIVEFLKNRISRRIRKIIRKYLFIRGLNVFERPRKNKGQKSRDTLPLDVLLTVPLDVCDVSIVPPIVLR